MKKAACIVVIVLTVLWILGLTVFRIKDSRIHYLLLVAAGIIGTRLFGSRKK